MNNKNARKKALTPLVGFIPIIAIALLVGGYLSFALISGTTESSSTTTIAQTSTSTTTNSVIQGVVTGYVTVGPSQPVCSANQSCTEDMTGYSIVFSLQCPTNLCYSSQATLSPSGHYSILLPPGNYSVSGLEPSCKWMGCSTSFPQTVTVLGGMQLVFNVNIDTGIR